MQDSILQRVLDLELKDFSTMLYVNIKAKPSLKHLAHRNTKKEGRKEKGEGGEVVLGTHQLTCLPRETSFTPSCSRKAFRIFSIPWETLVGAEITDSESSGSKVSNCSFKGSGDIRYTEHISSVQFWNTFWAFFHRALMTLLSQIWCVYGTLAFRSVGGIRRISMMILKIAFWTCFWASKARKASVPMFAKNRKLAVRFQSCHFWLKLRWIEYFEELQRFHGTQYIWQQIQILNFKLTFACSLKSFTECSPFNVLQIVIMCQKKRKMLVNRVNALCANIWTIDITQKLHVSYSFQHFILWDD